MLYRFVLLPCCADCCATGGPSCIYVIVKLMLTTLSQFYSVLLRLASCDKLGRDSAESAGSPLPDQCVIIVPGFSCFNLYSLELNLHSSQDQEVLQCILLLQVFDLSFRQILYLHYRCVNTICLMVR